MKPPTPAKMQSNQKPPAILALSSGDSSLKCSVISAALIFVPPYAKIESRVPITDWDSNPAASSALCDPEVSDGFFPAPPASSAYSPRPFAIENWGDEGHAH